MMDIYGLQITVAIAVIIFILLCISMLIELDKRDRRIDEIVRRIERLEVRSEKYINRFE